MYGKEHVQWQERQCDLNALEHRRIADRMGQRGHERAELSLEFEIEALWRRLLAVEERLDR